MLSSFKGSPGEVLPPVHAPGRLRPQDRQRLRRLGREEHVREEAHGHQGLTFVIDADGNVARAMYGVKPEGHADEELEVLPG
jgi:hypothetical protein